MLWARIRLFFHTLINFHCSFLMWDEDGLMYAECADCENFKTWVRKDYVS